MSNETRGWMISLSDNEINRVNDLLISRGITYETLRNELLDHLCCLIEQSMDTGIAFQDAMDDSILQFGDHGIEKTQEATLFLLTLKHKKMKKSASILGIIGGVLTIFGTLFKVMHWPGANILLLLGLAVTALFFMPTALYVNYKTKEGIRDKATLITGFIGGSVLIIFSLFKILHWPGAAMLLFLGLFIMIFIFIPLYYVKSYRNPDNRWFDIGSLTVILAGIIMVFTLYNFNGNKYLDAMKRIEDQSIKSYKELVENIALLGGSYSTQQADIGLKIKRIETVTQLVVADFFEYRNDLLEEEYANNYMKHMEILESLNQMKIEELKNWDSFKASIDNFVNAPKEEKTGRLAGLVKSYQQLASEMAASDFSVPQEFSDIVKLLESLPIKSNLDMHTSLFLISTINMAEYQMRSFEKSLIENIIR